MKTTKLVTYFLLAAIALTSTVFNACKGKDPEPPTDSTGVTVPVESISLEPTLSITVGEYETLTATVLPANATDKTVTWTSSNANATVDENGKVTAVSAGTAIITATAGGKTATCTVTILEENTNNPVTSITLNKTDLELDAGKFETLTATVLPSDATNKTVTWTSSNTDVATVANGKVTAINEGTAIITATAGGKTATCTITITINPLTYDKGVIINGIKWATRNVDAPGTFADKIYSSGMLYQWGKNIGWSATNPLINSNGSTTWDTNSFAGNIWEKGNDPCPVGWRVPTVPEIESLINSETFLFVKWATSGGVAGKMYIPHDPINIYDYDNAIFFPAVAGRESILGDGVIKDVNDTGNYWSSTRYYGADATFPAANYMAFNKSSAIICHGFNVSAMPIRCVAE